MYGSTEQKGIRMSEEVPCEHLRRKAREIVWFAVPGLPSIVFMLISAWLAAWLASVVLAPIWWVLAWVGFAAMTFAGWFVIYKFVYCQLQDAMYPDGPYKLREDREREERQEQGDSQNADHEA